MSSKQKLSGHMLSKMEGLTPGALESGTLVCMCVDISAACQHFYFSSSKRKRIIKGSYFLDTLMLGMAL